MLLRDRGTSGRREDALRPHVPRASAPSGAVPVATDPAPSPPPPSTLTPRELVRAAWHAFPGFLTVFLVVTAFPDERHRTCTVGVAALDQRGEGHRRIDRCIVRTQAVGASDAGDSALVSDRDHPGVVRYRGQV